MKPFLMAILVLAACSSAAGQGKYKDQPLGLDAKGVALLKKYEDLARSSLPHFDEEFGKANGRTFFVVTKVHDGNLFEQIYVRVESKKGESYRGRITSDPMGPVKFKKNAEIDVIPGDVADWCIVQPDGEELGNLTGKALDALRAGTVVLIISMQPEKGTYTRFRVVSVRNPNTQQEIREIVPEAIVAGVEREAKKRFARLKPDDGKEKFQFILVSFPEWEILPP